MSLFLLPECTCQGKEQIVRSARRLLEGADVRRGSSQTADLPDCSTPWEIFNSTSELSFWAEALQTVGFAGGSDGLSFSPLLGKEQLEGALHCNICIHVRAKKWCKPPSDSLSI